MAAPNSFSNLKTNVGRSVTKKWREANQISYDGDDWGDEDEYEEQPPVPADVGGHSQWAAPHPGFHRSNRSVTNPSPSRIGGRASFDHGDDRRAFSAGFDSAYPTTQRSPFPEPQHDDELSSPGHRGQPPLRLNTQPQGPMSPGNFRPGSRGRQYPQYDAPFSAPGGFPQQRRSGSSNRPPPGDIYQRHDSPMRPDSRGSGASVRQFPPRKASLSQLPPQMSFTQEVEPANPAQFPESSNNDDKPVPVFVRPSDIYKRMPEEMEKVRKSQESARPSLDSIIGRPRAGSAGARSTSSEHRDVTTAASQPFEDPDSARRLKPTLDPVPERKSEYGFDNIVQASQALESESRMNPEPGDGAGDDRASVSRHGTTASSVYTDRPDPVSASSVSRNVSLSENIPEADHDKTSPVRPTFALPAIGRVSGFGMDFGASTPEFQSGVQSSTDPELPTSQQADLEPNNHGLQHQQSFGYRSMVQQAFDESQNQDSYSPVSPSATVDRSNSASTADISPIITRKQEHSSTVSDYEPTHPTIPEESLPTNSRPTSTATLRPREAKYDEDELSPPPTIRTGYRREATPPSPDNSPAKRPLSIELPAAPQPQRGDVGFEQEQERTEQSPARERALLEAATEKPLPPTPGADSREPNQNLESSPPSAPTSSEIQQEWQAQREQFSDQQDAPNNSQVPPDLPSPIKRSETPARGTVRDLAGKLETLSGRSTPSNFQGSSPDQGRPPAQPRLESFRPAIPGGWQSFTSVAESSAQGSTSTLQSSSDLSQIQYRPPFAPTHVESTESIPTAKAPENHGGAEPDSITHKAFAAAASAGSALAESLTGHRPIPEPDASGEASEDSSENEWDASSNSSKQDVDRVSVRDQTQEQTQGPPSAETAEPAGRSSPTYPSEDKNTPLDVSPVPPDDGGQHDTDAADSHADSYFPAPLRTARLSATVSRPPIPEVTVQQGSPSENDNERLELEIEKSLTPRSSDLTGANDSRPAQIEVTNTDEAPSFADPRSSSSPLSSETRDVPRQESSSNSELAAIIGGAPSIAAQATESTMVSSENRALPQQGPSKTTRDEGALAASAPATRSFDEPPVGKDGRPFLQQRFSWETQIEPEPPISTPKRTTPPPTSPPNTSPPHTIRATSQPDSRPVDTNDPDINKAAVHQEPTGEQSSGAASQANARPDGSRLDIVSSDGGLRVQHDRPHSIVSDVSSIGPVPENAAGLHTTRSISPADPSPGVSETSQNEEATMSHQGLESSNVAGSEPSTAIVVGQDTRPSLEQLPPPPGIDEPYITPEEVGMHVETTAPRGSLEKDVQNHTQQEQVPETDRTRPFSFAGPEGIGQTHGFSPAEGDLSRETAQLSPATRTFSNQSLSKEASRINAGDAQGQSNILAHRQSRSYSRPFGADAAVTNQPSLRSGELVQPPGDRMQNPLPSARRPQDGVERMHYQRQDQQVEEGLSQMGSRSAAEEGYRIPGPYVQEYRSPKHISTPKSARSQTQVLASGEPLPSALRAQHRTGQSPRPTRPFSTSYGPDEQRMSQSYQIPEDTAVATGHPDNRDVQYQYDLKPKALHQEQVQPAGRQSMSVPRPQSMSDSAQQRQSLVYPPPQRQSMGPPPVPTQHQHQSQPPVTSSPATKRPKKGFFGALFGSSSSGRSKLQKDVGPDQSGSGHHKEKRNSLFRRNSRHDSISSQQSSLYQDQTGQLPPANLQSLSQDPSRSNKRQSRELLRTPTPETAKKKRFSGLGNRLFKTSSHSKMEATSATEHSSIMDSNTAQREQGQQLSSRPVMSPLTYHPSSQEAAYEQYNSGYGPYRRPSSGVVPPDPGQDPRWGQYPPRNVQRQQAEPPNMNIASPYHQQTARPISYPYPSGDAPQHRHVQGLRQPAKRPYASTPSPYTDPSDGNSRPADLRIDTGGGGGRGTLSNNGGTGYVLPATAPAQVYPTGFSASARADLGRAAPSYTSGSLSPSVPTGTMTMATSAITANDNNLAPNSSTPVAAAYHQPYGARQQKPPVQNDQRAYVLNLHKRSRSPRLGRKTSSDEDLNVTAGRVRQASPGSASPHVERLGTFSSKKISPVGGIPRAEDDQERPFAINVPGLDNDENDESDRGSHADDSHIEEGRNHKEGAVNRGGVETSVTLDDQVQLPLQNPDRDRNDGFEEGHPSDDNVADRRRAPFHAQVTRTETEQPVSERGDEGEEESRLSRASAGHGGVQVSGVAQRDAVGAGVGATPTTTAAAAAIGSGGSKGGGGDDGNISPTLPQGHDGRQVSLSEELKAQLEAEENDQHGRGNARDHVRDVTAGGVVAELPGSGYESDSEEEIRMSATAYPGQEWVPMVVDVGDGRWDD
ncbi:hypothetical protein KCU88_g4827, partial [Aureobasidium melanogenum]